MRVTVVALVVVVLAACSGGSGSSPSSTTGKGAPVELTVTAAEVVSAVTPAPAFPDDVRAGVTATLDRYLQAATATALRTGKAPAALDQVFTASTRPRLATPDRQALTDEGLPRARLRHATGEVVLTALAGPDGTVGVVVARVVERAQATGGLDLTRTGDLTLVPEEGAWRVDGYDVAVTRQVPGRAPATTTATSGATP